MNQTNNRDTIIVRTSVIGIIANVFLAGFKVAAGLLAHSIAIVMDAVNNLSDALSSLITIIATKLAAKMPDAEHPFGYGRIEYLSATVISVIVLYAGVTALVESVKSILHPELPDYSPVTLIIVAVGVIVKIVLGRYVQSVGEKVNSDSLVASGADASNDAIISSATLVAAILYMTLHISVEAYLAAVISIVIIKAGLEMLKDTLSEILGERIDPELSHHIKKAVIAHPKVLGAYDLFLHNYGPDKYRGSIHVEVEDIMTAEEIDVMTRDIQQQVIKDYGVILETIGIYSHNTRHEDVIEIRKRVIQILRQFEDVKQFHGFYVNQEEHLIQFDIVIGFESDNRLDIYEQVYNEVSEAFPDYALRIALDDDVSD